MRQLIARCPMQMSRKYVFLISRSVIALAEQFKTICILFPVTVITIYYDCPSTVIYLFKFKFPVIKGESITKVL